MISIDVRSDLRTVAARFEGTIAQALRPAVARSLNRAAVTVRKESSTEIRKVYNIPARIAKGQVKIKNATRERLEALVVARGRRLPLVVFAARKTRQGVTVSVKKGSRKLIPHAFIGEMGPDLLIGADGSVRTDARHRGVFMRVLPRTRTYRAHAVRKRMAPKYSDLPIAELFSVSLPQAFSNDVVMTVLERIARVRFLVEVERELKFALSKLK